MSNFENYDFILHDGVVIENEKADKEGRKKRMSAMCVKVREQTNMNRKEFKLTGSWMSYSSPFPGKEWELTAHYFATGQLKFAPGFIYKKMPMSQAQEAFQLFKIKGKIFLINED